MPALFLWCMSLGQAKHGDADAATHVLRWLAEAVRESNLPVPMRDFLALALEKIAAAPPGRVRESVTRRYLLLGGRQGRKPQYKVIEERFSAAQEVFDRDGVVSGEKLNRAITDALVSRGIGNRGTTAPDVRAVKKVYRENLPYFIARKQEEQDEHEGQNNLQDD